MTVSGGEYSETILGEIKNLATRVEGLEKVTSADVIVMPDGSEYPMSEFGYSDTAIKVYVQDNAPTGLNSSTDVGDRWYDSNDNNKLYSWDGLNWIVVATGEIYHGGVGLQSLGPALVSRSLTNFTIYVQGTAPATPTHGTIWKDTASGNVIKYWDSTTPAQWETITDQNTIDAVNNALAAPVADVSDSQLTVFYQATAPGGRNATTNKGDKWYDTDAQYKEYTWDGGVWVAGDGTVQNTTTDGNPPSTSPTPTVRAGIGSLFVQWTATSNADPVWYNIYIDDVTPVVKSSTTFVGVQYGTFTVIQKLPDGTALSPGVTYYVKIVAVDDDGPGPDGSEASGSVAQIALTELQQTVQDDINKIDTIETTANGKNTNYYQAAQPTGGTYKVGDLWFDSDDNYKAYAWTGTAWQVVQDAYSAMQTASSKNKVYYQTAQPTGGVYSTGDIWIDTDDNYKAYAWSGSAWQLVQDSAAAQVTANAAILRDGLSTNPIFDDWPSGTHPTGYIAGTGTPVKETATANVRTLPYALRWNVTAATNAYDIADSAWSTLTNVQYVTVTMDVMLVSGDFSGAGALVRWVNTVPTNFDATYHLATDIPSPVLNKWYRVTRVFQRPAGFTGTFSKIQGAPLGGYTTLGTVTAKNIIFDQFQVRPASEQEIQAYNSATAQSVTDLTNTVNTKNTSYYQTGQPSGGTYKVGDLWIDTDDGYKLYSWTGSAWQVVQDSASKNKTYYQIAQPTGGVYTAGDLWIDTDDNYKVYSWTGSAWQLVQDSATANTTANTALTSANGKNRVYYQTAQPTGGTYINGDTWYDTDDGYKMYVYSGGTWTASQLGTNALADLSITNAKIADATIQSAKIAALDAGKITTGTLDAARIGAGSIVTSMLSAGAITADKMAANSITADALTIGSIGTGLVLNPSFDTDANADNKPDGWYLAEGTGTTWDRFNSGDAPTGTYVLRIQAGGAKGIGCKAFPVTPGKIYYVRCRIRATGSTGSYTIRMNYDDAGVSADGQITSSNRLGFTDLAAGVANTTTWALLEYTWTAPSNAYWASISFINGDTGTTSVYVDDVDVRAQTTGVMIANGTIVAANIGAGAVTTNAIASGSITTDLIDANAAWVGTMSVDQLTGGTLSAAVVLGTTITTRTGNTGAGVEISPDGINVYGSDNIPKIVLPANISDMNSAMFKGDIETDSIMVNDGLTLRGSSNELSRQSTLTLAQGTTQSSSTPTLNVKYTSYQLSGLSLDGMELRNMWWRSDVSKWQFCMTWYSGSTRYIAYPLFNTDGSYSSGSSAVASTSSAQSSVYVSGIQIGANQYSLIKTDYATFRLRNETTATQITVSTSTNQWPTLGIDSDGTTLLLAEYDGSNAKVRRYNSSLSLQSTTTLSGTVSSGGNFTGVLYGTFDFATSHYVLISNNGTSSIMAWDGTTRSTNEDWPRIGSGSAVGGSGLAWDGSNFWQSVGDSSSGVYTIYKFEGGGNKWTTESSTWWAGFTWKDTNAGGTGTHETAVSKLTSITMKKRAKLEVTLPPLPPASVPASSDDVDSAGLYLGRGTSAPTYTTLYSQGTTASNLISNGTFESTDLSNWESNSAFTTYVPATFARDTARAHGGTYSLKVTLPNSSGSQSWVNHKAVQFVDGATYRFTAWAYVPTGVPDVRFDIVFYASSSYYNTKDAWFQMTWDYTHHQTGTNSYFPGIGAANTTAGQNYWIDDFTITPLDTAQPLTITNAAFSGTNPPATTNFPNSTPSLIQSAASDGSGRLFWLKGDGSGRWGDLSFANDGTVSATNGWVTSGFTSTNSANYSWSGASIRRAGGYVEINVGYVSNSSQTFASNSGAIGDQLIGTIPSGYAPSSLTRWGCGNHGGVSSVITINTSGQVYVQSISGSGANQTFGSGTVGYGTIVYVQ